MGLPAATSLRRAYASLPTLVVAGLTLAWAATPSIPVLVRGMGMMAPPDARLGFYARTAGEVQAVNSPVGASVRRGEPLLTIERVGQSASGSAGPMPQGPQVTEARLAAVAQQQRTLRAQATALDAQQEALRVRRRQIETTNGPVGEQLRALEALRADNVIARYSPLWVGAQDLWLRNKADIATVDGRQAELQAQRAALRAQAAELAAQRALLESDELSQVVFSPADGRVLDLAVRPGQPVAPGERLGSIALPRREPERLAVVLFTSADASRLEVGDAVKLNPQLLSRDSYGGAEQRFGLVPGRLVRLSEDSVGSRDVAAEVGSEEEALHLMAAARQRSLGEGGDLTGQLPDRSGAPLVLGVVRLEEANTPSGLAWSRGNGPGRPLPQRTPAEVEAEVEMRSLLSYLTPFWRWITGARA